MEWEREILRMFSTFLKKKQNNTTRTVQVISLEALLSLMSVLTSLTTRSM